jgi:hypothetical protein
MQQDQFLELLDAIVGDHLIRDAVDILKVVGCLHEGAHIEIRRYGLKRGPGARGRHCLRCQTPSTVRVLVGFPGFSCHRPTGSRSQSCLSLRTLLGKVAIAETAV